MPELAAEGTTLAALKIGDEASRGAPRTTISPSVILQVVLQTIAFLNDFVIAKVVVLNSLQSITEQGKYGAAMPPAAFIKLV